jgi:L-threonylcarbamoyladenylate synthase
VLAWLPVIVRWSGSTRVLSIHTPALFEAAVLEASEELRRGNLVALPTETVYGLAANALDPSAVEAIYRVKGRPARNPIIVHVADLPLAQRCVAAWPAAAGSLAQAFWPGPLTLVLPRSEVIPDVVTAGGRTVGVRWPSHPFIQAVIGACGFPLAAPSANLSNRVSATMAEHVLGSLGGRIPLVIDGGMCQVGIESTVLDLAVAPPRVLRPGMIHVESLVAVVGRVDTVDGTPAGELRSPGLLERHYAPRAKLTVLSWSDESDLDRQMTATGQDRRTTFILAHTRIPSGGVRGNVSVIPHDPEAFARALYAELHRCDEAGAGMIVVEAVPATPPWAGIEDRLRRASARGGR